MEVTEGPYKGFIGEEPEYEALAAMGPVIDQKDPGAAVMLANLIDIQDGNNGLFNRLAHECYGGAEKKDLMER
jgi:hypothetical protein